MRKQMVGVLGWAMVSGFLGQQASAAGIADLQWMAGCWAQDDREAGSGEQWMAPAGGMMLGMSRTVRKGKAFEHEFMQIRETEGGKLEFIAHPGGQPGVTFSQLSLNENEVVFENLQNEFPQRVRYRLEKEGRIFARIEAKREDGQERVIDFPLQKVDCEAGPSGN